MGVPGPSGSDVVSDCSPLAYSASIIALTKSIRFSRLRLMKLVSTRTRYGGTRASLCDKKSEVGSGALCVR